MKYLSLRTNEINNLVSGQLLKNTWPQLVLYLSPRYGYVILVSGYLVLTAVNWPWNASPISNGKVIIDLYIFFGHHLARLCRLINILRLHLSLWYGHVKLVSGFLVLTVVNWHEYPMSFHWCKPLCNLKFTKLARLRLLPRWCYTVVGDSMRPPALLLAMLTMKKETLGFLNFYAWFSSFSPISIHVVGMGLRCPALWASEAPL